MNINANSAVRLPVLGNGTDNKQRTADNQGTATASSVTIPAPQSADLGVLLSLSEPPTVPADELYGSQEEATHEEQLEALRETRRDTTQKLREAMEAGDAMADHWREKLLALRIAMRIASGNNVPARDRRFLMEFDSDMYGEAVRASLIAANNDPNDYEALTEDPSDDERARSAVDDAGASTDTATTSTEPQSAEPVDAAV